MSRQSRPSSKPQPKNRRPTEPPYSGSHSQGGLPDNQERRRDETAYAIFIPQDDDSEPRRGLQGPSKHLFFGYKTWGFGDSKGYPVPPNQSPSVERPLPPTSSSAPQVRAPCPSPPRDPRDVCRVPTSSAEVRPAVPNSRLASSSTVPPANEPRRDEMAQHKDDRDAKKAETRSEEGKIERERALGQPEDDVKVREADSRKQEAEAWRNRGEAGKKDAEVKDAKKGEEEPKWEGDKAEDGKAEDDKGTRQKQELAARIAMTRKEGHLPKDEIISEEQMRLRQQEYAKEAKKIKEKHEKQRRESGVGNGSACAPLGSSSGVANPLHPQFSAAAPWANAPASAPTPNHNSAWRTLPPAKVAPASTAAPNGRAASSSTLHPANKPRHGSVSSGSQHQRASVPSPQTQNLPFSEIEWARRQAEFSADQQAKFRREQEKTEAERQLEAVGKPLNRDEVGRLMEHHDRLWTRLPSINKLTWTDFPWPVLRNEITNADEITSTFVNHYFQSPLLPEKDKLRPTKDRIKEHLRRWHPDRFESKVLPRVVDAEKEKVKQAAGNVVRCLNDLLRKENETANLPSPFGE